MYSQNDYLGLSEFSSNSKTKNKLDDLLEFLKLDDAEEELQYACTPPPDVMDQYMGLGDEKFLKLGLDLPQLSNVQDEANYGFSATPLQNSSYDNGMNIIHEQHENSQLSSLDNIDNNYKPLAIDENYMGASALAHSSSSSCDYNPDQIRGQHLDVFSTTTSFDMQTIQNSSSAFSPSSSSSFSNCLSPEYAEFPTGSSKPSRKKKKSSLSTLTDDEKYARIRDQNNIASREYRGREKNKRVTNQQKLKELLSKNQHLKNCEQNLECQYEQCMKIKNMLQNLGYKFSDMNLT